MANTIEIEAKALVSEEDYKKLLRKFEGNPRYFQTNYYIDSSDWLLSKECLGLRIRFKEGVYEMTCKAPLSEGSYEKTAELDKSEFFAFKNEGKFPHNDVERFLTMLDVDVNSLKIITSLTTDRTDVEYEGGILSIDKNTYGDNVDFEVELEYNNLKDSEKLIKELFEKEGIKFNGFAEYGKRTRALKAYEKENK